MFKKLHEILVTPYAQKIQFGLLLILCIVLFGRDLNPFSNQTFLAHDETQAARIQQFHVNVSEGNIPPRIAPDFSYGLGYPVFNYYAPFPYWIVELFQRIGFPLLSAMKLTYLTAIIVGFISMFLFLKKLFSFYPALLGSFLYVTSPYVAVDIFVRGNLGETAVFALFPLALYLLLTNSTKRILLTAVVLSFLFTSHNILSLISLILISVFVLLTHKRMLNFYSIGAGLLMSSYFLLPAVLELSQVQATNIATKTNFADHFLCLSQIWSSLWGYAGSAPGCAADGMSFMLGKMPILLGVTGGILFIYTQYIYKPNNYISFLNKTIESIINTINNVIPAFRKDSIITSSESKKIALFILLVTISSLYLTIYASAWIWHILSPLFSLFQFPWRFLMFTLFGISYFSAYLLSHGTRQIQLFCTLLVLVLILLIHPKYFVGQMVSTDEFSKKFLSEEYIKTSVAYKVAEYVPKTVNFNRWKHFEKNPQQLDLSEVVVNSKKKDILILEEKPFSLLFMAKSDDPVLAQIHYAPYWKILVDYVEFIPTRFDDMGRPYIPVSDNSYTSVQITYAQTPVEIFANLLSILTSAILTAFVVKQFTLSWKNTIIKKT